MIQCNTCNQDKDESNFCKSKSTKTGYQYKCRDCEKEYRTKNKEKISKRMRSYRLNNLDKEKQRTKAYYQDNKETISQRNKKWNEGNKDKIKEQKKDYYKRTKKERARASKNWRMNNLEQYRKYQREYAKHKRNTSPHYKLEHRLRNRLLSGLKKNGNKKLDRFWNLVGCTKQELKIHIEKQFTEGMTWETFNSGKVVIDHIKPCCSFDLSKLEEQQKCFHYSNLRPMWDLDNKAKISDDLKQSIGNNKKLEVIG